MTHSLQTKKTALRYFDEGNNVKKSALMANVPYATLRFWLYAREREDEQPIKRKRLIDHDKLREFLTRHPSKTLRQLHQEWDGPPCHLRTFYNALRDINYQLKAPRYYRRPLKSD